tara:strand:+ start:5226 stop:6323 length:1098 start_codon:yes stop_codon:yes gene_type:complete
MEFFNKKEEVIDLQLTQHGKHLLSRGKFKPIYYAFYDDGILYDGEYGSDIREIQNNTEGRIQENTPNLKTQYVFHDLDKGFGEALHILTNTQNQVAAQQALAATPEQSQILITPLGSSDLGSEYLPAWKISTLSGEFLPGDTTPTLALSGSNTILNIPQIGCEIVYNVSVEDMTESVTQDMLDAIARGDLDGTPQSVLEEQLAGTTGYSDVNYNVHVFDDNTFLKVESDSLIMRIIEDNVNPSIKGYEIEVFEVEDIVLGNKTVTQLNALRFINEPDLIVDNILLDESEVQQAKIVTDSSFVNHYFDLEVDEEIDAGLICSKIQDADKTLYKLVTLDFECPDATSNYQFLSPYAQKTDDEECGNG